MGDTFLEQVAGYIEEEQLLRRGQRVLVGVSGGVDSMVCLEVLRRLSYEVHAVHFNYGLREGADADEALVRRWCEEQSSPIPLTVEALDAGSRAEREGESLQEAARRLRYDAMADYAEGHGIEVVAVGHHRDDQAETLLLNLLRGAGPEGLAGMSPRRSLGKGEVDLVRPLLVASRSQIAAYAEAQSLPFREDPSNRDPAYDRTFIRSEVIPLLQERFPNAPTTLARSAALVRQYVEQTLTPALEERLERAFVQHREGGGLRLDVLRDDSSVWRRRLILEALKRTLPDAPRSAAVAEEIEELVGAQVGRRVEAGGGTVWRERGELRFVSSCPPAIEKPVSLSVGDTVSVAPGVLEVEPMGATPDAWGETGPHVEYADADRLGKTLVLRSWREGDRFRPLGMEGTKRVSEFLTDEQVPPHRRPATCVLCTEEHLAWVVGHRLDDRVRVRDSTRRVVRLTWTPRENQPDDCISA